MGDRCGFSRDTRWPLVPIAPPLRKRDGETESRCNSPEIQNDTYNEFFLSSGTHNFDSRILVLVLATKILQFIMKTDVMKMRNVSWRHEKN